MAIGVFNHGWWTAACEAIGQERVALPVAQHPSGNAYAADLNARIESGSAVLDILSKTTVDALFDNGATGLAFVRNTTGEDLKLVHEVAGRALYSHLIDPLTTALQGLDWRVVWPSLSSLSWIKAVWDLAQVVELQRFGIPNVVHLPMAAPDREYDTRPFDPSRCRGVVSFVGGQNTNYFAPGVNAATGTLLAGVLAQAVRSDLPDTRFYDVYHAYGLGDPLSASDTLDAQATKSLAYFQAKLFCHAGLCIRNRDRFVIHLARSLGDRFHLVGHGWDRAYGLRTEPRFETTEAYFENFREAAINLNLVNGNAETGLNMRHFEITAAGGFMLCYQQPELQQHFEIGKECDVFHSEVELAEKIDYYLARPKERLAIARAGQVRTLKEHLHSHRVGQMLRAMPPSSLPLVCSTADCWEDLRSLVSDARVILDCGNGAEVSARRMRERYPSAIVHRCDMGSGIPEVPVSRSARKLEHATIAAAPEHTGATMRETRASLAMCEPPTSPERIRDSAGEHHDRSGHAGRGAGSLDDWCRKHDIDVSRVDVARFGPQNDGLESLSAAEGVLASARAVLLEVSLSPLNPGIAVLGDVDGFLAARGFRRHAVYPTDLVRQRVEGLYVRT